MIWLSRTDLRKLAALCEDRRFSDELVRDNSVDGTTYSYGERCLAAHEAEYMKGLSEKLLKVADSTAKRVEIVF